MTINSDTNLPQAMLVLQSDAVVLAQLKAIFARLAPGMDMSEQNFPHQLLQPAALAIAQLYVDLEDIERRTSLATANAQDLDRLGFLYGVDRTPASKATGIVRFTGTIIGTSVPCGTHVTTTGAGTVVFETTVTGQIPSGGYVDISIQAVTEGADGNVGAGTITLFGGTPPAGITTVTNANPTAGGSDIQVDGPTLQYLTGYRADIHDLSNAKGEGGADKHIRKWARSVAGVGGVRVVDSYPTSGWTTVALVGSDMLPASNSLVLAVEDFILDCWRQTVEAETLTVSGYGVLLDTQSVDGTPVGGTNNTAKMSHHASGAGQLTNTGVQTVLVQPGIWRMRIRAKRGAAGTGNCLQFGVYDLTANAYLNTTFGGITTSLVTLTASQLTTSFAEYQTEFAWLGGNPIEARIIRMTPDTTTDVWIDEVKYWATMSRDDRDQGLAPGGMRLNCIPAGQVPVDIAADITYGLAAGQTTASVNADLHANLVGYFASIALKDDNDVRRSTVEDVIYGTRGVADVTAVQLNGATNNIVIGPMQVAVIGVETWT